MYEKYFHHKGQNWVRSEFKGKHKEHCLCFECNGFGECIVAKEVYKNCVKFNIVTPVWECPYFEGDKGEE